MPVRGAIVLTTINPPTDAVRAFDALEAWHVVVVGDRKTPKDWSCGRVTYLPFDQAGTGLAAALPVDHYSRKMLGYVAAARGGAAIIAESDDDNVPKPGWHFPDFEGMYAVTERGRGYINVYRSFTDQHIWPRGLPLRRVLDDEALVDESAVRTEQMAVGVWQALADGDPDVDAIYRLTVGADCVFGARDPLVLGAGTISPFNSQNTAFSRAAFPLLYLPATVTFRFTDILRGYVAQPILWAAGMHLGFLGATVEQVRNPHDYTADFRSEIPCYLDVERCVEVVSEAVDSGRTIGANLLAAYTALTEAGVTGPAETDLVGAWLDDLVAAGVEV
jgi:STELLO glycosyltransferases